MNIITKITGLLCLAAMASCSGGSGGQVAAVNDATVGLSECAPGDYFTAPPINLDNIVGIVPLGNLNPTGHTLPTDHIYFYLKADPNDSKKTGVTNLYSPGVVTVMRVASSQHITEGYTDYSLYFNPCIGVQAYFGHVQTLSDNMMALVGTFPDYTCQTYTSAGNEYKNCTKSTTIKLAAGDLIGTVGGHTAPSAFDFGLFDARITPLVFANPARITVNSDGFDGFHVGCPLDYYDSITKTSLEAFLGSHNGLQKRTASPLCGEVAQDVSGTAQGKWFLTSDTTTSMALVHDNVDPATPVFSLGAAISGLAAHTYSYTPTVAGLVNRDFKNITADGSVYCFESEALGKIILLQLTSATTLTIDSQAANTCGAGPWSFSSTASLFER